MRLVLGALLVAGSAACGGVDAPAGPPPSASARPGPGDHVLTIDVGGVPRTSLLHVPPGYTTASGALPLVIALHPYPGTGAQLRDAIGMDARADRHGFLVAYPDGVGNAFNALVCCGSADDVAFLEALTRDLVGNWRVDADRVHLAGTSNGGDMSFRAAVEASELFAAIGVVSGGYIGRPTEPATFVPTNPVSVVTIIGGRDPYFPAFQAGVATWRQRLGCADGGPAPAPPAPGVTRTSTRCADGSDVDVYVAAELGHTWPGATSGPLAARDAPLAATDVLWDFFAAHPKQR